jgi:hypothetical protein
MQIYSLFSAFVTSVNRTSAQCTFLHLLHVHTDLSFRHRQSMSQQALTPVERGDKKSSLSNDSKLGPWTGAKPADAVLTERLLCLGSDTKIGATLGVPRVKREVEHPIPLKEDCCCRSMLRLREGLGFAGKVAVL